MSDADITASWDWRRHQARLERYLLSGDEVVRLHRLVQRFHTDLALAFRDREPAARANMIGWQLGALAAAPDDADADAALSKVNDCLQLVAMRNDWPCLEVHIVEDERD